MTPPLRNPENIDLAKYPPPPGYVVASEEDVSGGEEAKQNWMIWSHPTKEWVIALRVFAVDHPHWTYLRPETKPKTMTNEQAVEIFRQLKEGRQGQIREKLTLGYPCRDWYDAPIFDCAAALLKLNLEVRIKPEPPKPCIMFVHPKAACIEQANQMSDETREHYRAAGYRVFIEQLEEPKP